MELHAESQKALRAIHELAGNRKIVFVSGNFNVIHPGHLRLFRFAKECGDFLVVGVLNSSSPDAHIDEHLRLEGTKSINWVDFSFILRDEPGKIIQAFKPAFVIKGKEWENRKNPEKEIVEGGGGKLLFCSGEISFSSVDLIQREWKKLNLSTIRKPKDFLERHGFSEKDLYAIIERFKELHVCVVGDTIVDEYITCDPLGMSQEDPTIVVTPVMQEQFIGGAAIVAAHARMLGADVSFFSVTGDDSTARFVEQTLEKIGVQASLYRDQSRPTTLKQRFRAAQKTLLRVSHLRQHSVGAEYRNQMLHDLREALKTANLVIFSDFNYGCLPQSLVEAIIEDCSKRNIMMVADSQSSSQVGDVSRFKGMTMLTPTEREARIALHEPEAGLVILAEKLQRKCNARNVILTLGSEGILINADSCHENKWVTDLLPAFNIAPKDVAGAGDSFLSCASMSLALGNSIWKSVYLGSLAAACQVGRVGNTPLSPGDLKSELGISV